MTLPSATLRTASTGRTGRRRRRLARCLSMALLTPLLCACARPALALADSTVADVEIVDRSTGERLPIYGRAGERWVAGVPGHRYAIRVCNRSSARLLAVMSVDGLNVLSGDAAAWNQRGYVFAPGDQYDVAGWRKSNDRVAAFEFSSVPDSYASRTGRPDNVGVIGVALFREAAEAVAQAVPAPPMAPGASEHRAAPSADTLARSERSADAARQGPPAKALSPLPSLGTAHGRSENSRVELTQFERARSTPDQIITIRYDRFEALVAMGIVAQPPGPNAFPDSTASYVPDPPAR